MSKILLTVGIDPDQTSVMSFADTATDTSIKTFIDVHSLAGITGLDSVSTPTFSAAPDAPDAGANCDRRAVVNYLDGDRNARSFIMPDPLAATEFTPEGERLTAASGQTLVNAYVALIDLADCTFVDGWIKQTV